MNHRTRTLDYRGDEALAALLEQDDLSISLEELRSLLAGVNGAPPARSPSQWQALLATDTSDALRDQLEALRQKLAPATTSWTRARVDAVREQMSAMEIDGFVVPRSDEHQNEYVPMRAERLAWITGFHGSAGTAVVLASGACIFVDGRYTLQVKDQVDLDVFETRHLIEEPPHQWLGKTLEAGKVLGYDPWMHTVDGAKRLRAACEKAGASLKPCETNPIDAAWTDQPAAPISPIIVQGLEHAGQDTISKRSEIAKGLDGGAVVLTTPDSIAWLLNIRGGDVTHTPLPLAFAVLHADATVDLCVDRRKLTSQTVEHLSDTVRVHSPEAFAQILDGLAGTRVQLDPSKAADWIATRLEAADAQVVHATDPCALPKACKNPTELEGAREAHRRDGAALTRFLCWIDEHAAGGGIDEIQAAERLHAFRAESDLLRDLSFDTISGAGPNGAIVHYRVTEETSRLLEPGTLYLVDSGAQYADGTTDVTRTVAIGEPTDEMRDRFTRVLQGHIALGTARFCEGTTGAQLDCLARLPLWRAGLDYDHGTGHGVGSYLGVHEGPHRISKATNTVALKPGMIASNEPGYYKTGEYGIRIENLVVVIEEHVDGGERDTLAFETITLAPIDRKLVAPSLLTDAEIDWLNGYHARVREAITPRVDEATARWLADATAPITR